MKCPGCLRRDLIVLRFHAAEPPTPVRHGMVTTPNHTFSVRASGYVVECFCAWRSHYRPTPLEAFADRQDHVDAKAAAAGEPARGDRRRGVAADA